MIKFMVVVLVALHGGKVETIIPTGIKHNTFNSCKQEIKHYAQENDVTITCVKIPK